MVQRCVILQNKLKTYLGFGQTQRKRCQSVFKYEKFQNIQSILMIIFFGNFYFIQQEDFHHAVAQNAFISFFLVLLVAKK